MPTRKNTGPKPSDAEQVEAWMAALDHPLKPGIELIRATFKAADPRIAERIKWNAPSYHLDGTDIATFGPRRGDKVLLVFHHPAIVDVASALLEGDFKDRRLAWFASLEEIESNRAEVMRIVQAIVQVIDAET